MGGILLVDDAALVREALAELLVHHGLGPVRQASEAEQALAEVTADLPDVVVLDVRMPPTWTTEGIDLVPRLRRIAPSLGILLLSNHIEIRGLPALLQASPHAGLGYLLKERASGPDQLIGAIRAVGRGEVHVDEVVIDELIRARPIVERLSGLSARERQILGALARGLSNRAIAEELVVSPRTVESLVRGVLDKLGLPPEDDVNRRVCAVLIHLQHGAHDARG